MKQQNSQGLAIAVAAIVSKYTGEERKRVQGLLMGGLFERPSEAFSVARAKELISKWESELKRRR